MLRHLAEPLDAGVFHGGVGVEALGDGVGDHCLPLLFQQFDQPQLLGNQPINPCGFVVEEGCYLLSLALSRTDSNKIFKL
ncbi:hypothetical protein BFG06_21440 [Aeromonas caviae]|nr:hypothetical protein BFG06_21440 [Aeromonas caviae]